MPIVLATDDPGLMRTTLREQFEIAAEMETVGYLDLKGFALNSLRYSFLPETEREALERSLLEDFAVFEAQVAARP